MMPPIIESKIRASDISGNTAPPVSGMSKAEEKSSWQKFKSWLKDTKVISGGLANLSRLEILHKYRDYLAAASAGANAIGYGKVRSKKKLVKQIHQIGGSWNDFTNWVKRAANTVGNAAKKAGNFVYNKAIKPAYNYVKDKPLSAISKVAGVAGMIPSPFSGALKAASAAAGAVGEATGKGIMHKGIQKGGAMEGMPNRVLMVW